jgi:MFS family permease
MIDTAPITELAEPAITESVRRRGLVFVALAVALAGFTIAIQMGVNANFVVQEMGLSPPQQGWLESFRESCGIVAFLVLALLAGWSEPRVGLAMLVLVGVGLSCYTFVHGYMWLVLASLVWSQGLHVWMPLPNSMTLALAEPNRVGYRLGRIQASGAIGSGIGLAVALVLILFKMPIRPLYIVAGLAALLAAAACMGIPRNIKTPGPRLVFRKKYSLYYALCFLEGWRKQIFITFAGYLLVNQFDTPVWAMLTLWLATNVVSWFLSPRVGRLIDRIGERRVLVVYYSGLAALFVGYAFVRSPWMLYALFIADSSLFTLGMGLTTYVRRIAPLAEHTATLSMGVAMNHVAAVIMPPLGGLLWVSVGYKWTFLMGSAVAVIGAIVATRVPQRQAEAGVAEPSPVA